MVETIRTQLMRQMSARCDQANKWNKLICPIFETMRLDSFNDSRSWQVSKANEDVFEIHLILSITIDITNGTCSVDITVDIICYNFPITQMVETIRTQLMRQMSARRDQANKWNKLICPTFETMLLDSFNDSRSWQVNKANEDVFEVHSILSVTVDIARHTCSCFKWQINEFPCDHAVIAIQKSRYNLNDCVEHYFHVETYRAAYSGVIFPISSVEKPPFDPTDFTIYPLIVKRPLGRPKKNRIPSRGEKLKQIRCGRCNKLGSHNQKSCKEPI
ncbi:hypothetical protein CsSME_00046761 [Camellia sinensis var. sinensis]